MFLDPIYYQWNSVRHIHCTQVGDYVYSELNHLRMRISFRMLIAAILAQLLLQLQQTTKTASYKSISEPGELLNNSSLGSANISLPANVLNGESEYSRISFA